MKNWKVGKHVHKHNLNCFCFKCRDMNCRGDRLQSRYSLQLSGGLHQAEGLLHLGHSRPPPRPGSPHNGSWQGVSGARKSPLCHTKATPGECMWPGVLHSGCGMTVCAAGCAGQVSREDTEGWPAWPGSAGDHLSERCGLTTASAVSQNSGGNILPPRCQAAGCALLKQLQDGSCGRCNQAE